MSIWSWDLDQPPANEMRSRDRRCGAMERNGRWVVQNCNMKLPVACRKIGTSGKVIDENQKEICVSFDRVHYLSGSARCFFTITTELLSSLTNAFLSSFLIV